MPTCKVWDLIRVAFPYTNRPVQQRRPALVVAVQQDTGAPELLWVLMVTSAANRGWPSDVPISDMAAAGLPTASDVRCAKITTIETMNAARIGELPSEDRAKVREALGAMLAGVLAG